jgi:hypothetical protein
MSNAILSPSLSRPQVVSLKYILSALPFGLHNICLENLKNR